MHIQFAELPVFDQDRAKHFYGEVFGCSVVADSPMGAEGWRWIELGLPGAQTNLHFIRRGDNVRVTIDTANFSVSYSAVATQDGRPGETIALRGNDPKNLLSAVVTGPGRARIQD